MNAAGDAGLQLADRRALALAATCVAVRRPLQSGSILAFCAPLPEEGHDTFDHIEVIRDRPEPVSYAAC